MTSDQTWRLKCVDNTWTGLVGNCSHCKKPQWFTILNFILSQIARKSMHFLGPKCHNLKCGVREGFFVVNDWLNDSSHMRSTVLFLIYLFQGQLRHKDREHDNLFRIRKRTRLVMECGCPLCRWCVRHGWEKRQENQSLFQHFSHHHIPDGVLSRRHCIFCGIFRF